MQISKIARLATQIILILFISNSIFSISSYYGASHTANNSCVYYDGIRDFYIIYCFRIFSYTVRNVIEARLLPALRMVAVSPGNVTRCSSIINLGVSSRI